MGSKTITSWKPGQSGNPKGRAKQGRALSEMLEAAMEEAVIIGADEVTAKAILARCVREFVLSGVVWLNGKKIEAESVNDWFGVVRWLYEQVDGKAPEANIEETELVVKVIRDDDGY